MAKHILTGCMGAIWGNLISGVIFVFFGNSIGMTPFHWGILGGITSWVVAAQPLGAILGERTRSRKKVFFWFAITDRFLRMSGVICAYLLWRSGNHSGYLVFMLGVCVATLVGNMAQGPWFGWLATIIPQHVHGTFWGRRDSWISLATISQSFPRDTSWTSFPPRERWKPRSSSWLRQA